MLHENTLLLSTNESWQASRKLCRLCNKSDPGLAFETLSAVYAAEVENQTLAVPPPQS